VGSGPWAKKPSGASNTKSVHGTNHCAYHNFIMLWTTRRGPHRLATTGQPGSFQVRNRAKQPMFWTTGGGTTLPNAFMDCSHVDPMLKAQYRHHDGHARL